MPRPHPAPEARHPRASGSRLRNVEALRAAQKVALPPGVKLEGLEFQSFPLLKPRGGSVFSDSNRIVFVLNGVPFHFLCCGTLSRSTSHCPASSWKFAES